MIGESASIRDLMKFVYQHEKNQLAEELVLMIMVDCVIASFDSIKSVKGLIIVVKAALETMDYMVLTFVNDAGLHLELLVADDQAVVTAVICDDSVSDTLNVEVLVAYLVEQNEKGLNRL